MKRLFDSAIVPAVLTLLVTSILPSAIAAATPRATARQDAVAIQESPAEWTVPPQHSSGGQVDSLEIAGFGVSTFESGRTFVMHGTRGWNVTDYRSSEGRFSAYCASDVAGGGGGTYAPNMDSWMVFGPIAGLPDYADLMLTFDIWAELELDCDMLFVGISEDGETFEGSEFSGTTNGEWLRQGFDVSQYGEADQLWIAVAFESDESVEYEGVYVDQLALKGIPAGWENVALTPVYRCYNFRKGTHFYTTSAEERGYVGGTLWNTFRFDGIAYYTSRYNNPQPLYRFYNPKAGAHFYTASPTEAADVIARLSNVFTFEGQTYPVSLVEVPDSIPVFRFYNVQNGTHFYTASADERDVVIAKWPRIYRYEGTCYWISQAHGPFSLPSAWRSLPALAP